jgi:broad specificity phosphatase PhoE
MVCKMIDMNISESEPRMQRLWLARHGNTIWNSERRLCGSQDIPLSALGELQAEWVARQLSGVALSAIYTSDLLRTQQTAVIIAKRQAVSVPVIALPTWREMSFGKWEGLTYAQIAQQFPDEVGFFLGS